MKPLSLSAKQGNKSKTSLTKDGEILCETQENANISKKFYSELALHLVINCQKLPIVLNEFNSSDYYAQDYYAHLFDNKKQISGIKLIWRYCDKSKYCLNTNKASGMDQIPEKILEEAAGVLAYPLSKIINLSVKLSVYLEECNIAKLIPLFIKKLKNRSQKLQTYFPSACYFPYSKVIEKSIHYQLQNYLEENGLLYKYQLGIRANFSTDYCLVQPTDYFVLTDIDKEICSGITLIDLQKVFNRLDHKIILESMTSSVSKQQ